MLECAGGIYVVARIYSHFLGIESSHVGNVRIKVNIGYQRLIVALRAQFCVDVL